MTLDDRDISSKPGRDQPLKTIIGAVGRRLGLSPRIRTPRGPAALPDGLRVYAIGDIHGRSDLFTALLDQVAADGAVRDAVDTVEIILLGDLIDRGPDSAGVVRRAMAGGLGATWHVLQGNHEAAMIEGIDGDREMLRLWLDQGGDAALRSWGVDPHVIDTGTLADITAAAFQAIPAAERLWLRSRPLAVQRGDYYFVHAGVRPGVPLDRQSPRDALWIRNEFLASDRDHGVVVVHGHTRSKEVEERDNRIGIDTGAYTTDRLTALGLEGDRRWILST